MDRPGPRAPAAAPSTRARGSSHTLGRCGDGRARSPQPSLAEIVRRVGTHRLHRLRRPAGAHRAAARAVRRAARVADRRRSSSARSPPSTCSPARPRRSWRSTARGGCAARGGRAARRPLLHPARPGRDPRALGPVPVGIAAHVAARRRAWARARPSPRSPSAPGLASPRRSGRARRPPARARARLRAAGGDRGGARGTHGSCSCCSGAARSSSARARLLAASRRSHAWLLARRHGRARQRGRAPLGDALARWPLLAAGAERGRRGRARVDGAEGRRALLRRRLRDRAADAERRRRAPTTG